MQILNKQSEIRKSSLDLSIDGDADKEFIEVNNREVFETSQCSSDEDYTSNLMLNGERLFFTPGLREKLQRLLDKCER